jgi:hypothetical protein
MIVKIRELHDDVGRFLAEHGRKPTPDSQVAAELRSYERPKSLLDAYSQGTMLVEVAGDHMMAFAKTATEPVQTTAPWTCVRSLIESCALAAWLLDPNIEPRTRVQRSFAFRFEGLSQQVKFLRSIGDEIASSKAISRIDEVEQAALRLGFSQVQDKNGKRVGIGQIMPSITEIIKRTLDKESPYRLLSAMAHAHPWALQQLSFQKTEEPKVYVSEDSREGGKMNLLEKHLAPVSVAYLCNEVVTAFSEPISYKCQIFGWDMKHLESAFDSPFGV